MYCNMPCLSYPNTSYVNHAEGKDAWEAGVRIHPVAIEVAAQLEWVGQIVQGIGSIAEDGYCTKMWRESEVVDEKNGAVTSRRRVTQVMTTQALAGGKAWASGTVHPHESRTAHKQEPRWPWRYVLINRSMDKIQLRLPHRQHIRRHIGNTQLDRRPYSLYKMYSSCMDTAYIRL